MSCSQIWQTSTGKEGVNATIPVALVMIRAIRDYHERTGYKVGFKPAGGIRQSKDALVWLSLMKEELGDDWTFPNLFRIGASALLIDIGPSAVPADPTHRVQNVSSSTTSPAATPPRTSCPSAEHVALSFPLSCIARRQSHKRRLTPAQPCSPPRSLWLCSARSRPAPASAVSRHSVCWR